MTAQQRGLRRGLVLVAVIVLLVAGALVWTACRSDRGANTTAAATAPSASEPGGLFQLTDTHGKTVTDATLRGKPYAIFFGFTRCPDVCPTTMNRMTMLHKRLGAEADKLSIVFVSVDPEHDKPADIASFLSLFDTPVVGLTGTEEQLKQIEAAFKVYVARVPLENCAATTTMAG
ncbi:hypothetical protein CAF53_02065 [Sphingobium sp. LB126]|uniref:SCO family protein n=1 Tax=Sphingobium sp. LB126 TaxID=1983755 RepID=UPI000C20C080|nr:SCO family protein [Sphingobium sp. LB126]PJG47159.1 hypothetical protein CAF53_02065 [Sphingobium sp. LB126]